MVFDALRSPRFLFRVASDNSRGTNSSKLVDPLAGYEIPLRGPTDWENEYYHSFTSMSWVSANAMLYAHFKWSYSFPSAFSSWSASLLDALIYALMKKYVRKETNIIVYVLDTTKVSGEARIYHGQRLVNIFVLTRYPYAQDIWKKAEGEYLIYGKLHERDGFKAVELDALIEAGLMKLGKRYDPREWSEEEREWWFHGKIRVRSTYFHPRNSKKPPKKDIPNGMAIDDDGTEFWTLDPTYFPNTRRLGALFGHEWESTMTIAFLTLRRRDLRTDKVRLLFESLDGLPFLPVAPGFREDRFMDRLPDCVHFIRMLQMFHESQGHFTKELSVSAISRRLGWLGGPVTSSAIVSPEALDALDPECGAEGKQEQVPTPPSTPGPSTRVEDDDNTVMADKKRLRLREEMADRAQRPAKKKRKF